MKTERRHELQSNQLADFLTDVGEKAKPYAKGLLGLTLAALVIVCAYLYLSKRSEADEAASWDRAWQAITSQDMEALRGIVKDYPNKPAALWSQLILADMEFNKGVAELFTQKKDGRDLVRSALDDYQYVVEHAVQPLLREHALFGVGRAQESLGKLSDAQAAYEQLLKDDANGPYAKRAQLRLDDLARDSTKSWYDWFDKIEPAPSNFGKPGGLTSPFDDKGATGPSLPQLGPEFNLPDFGASKNPPPTPTPDQPKSTPDDKAKTDDKAKPAETAKPDDKAKTDDKAQPDSGKPGVPKDDVPKQATGSDDISKPNAPPPEVPTGDKSKTDSAKPETSK